ncbi:glycosyltransferase family 2 protein [Escherichia coli]|nr:glycosyltransferase family 2 protein [Escherichia coli]EFE8283367.1 glycosyltransferase family 2 protein [Escherichia coli]HAN9561400.1 glycosyltransferase family 2 protein [Escherichia coli]HAY4495856.1 glycosyltransferase family 2 protein [Escherichia coli]HCL9301300.1 glycosyltransferase family 2 protein [Escherichia coli]
MNELVSIITPTYNSQDYIIETYKSIRRQDYKLWEWIVTDDCSQDATFEILMSIVEKDSRVKLYRNSINSGAAISRNNSLAKAKGRFIAFIDSDDLWCEQKLSKQIDYMISTNCAFCFTSFELIDQYGKSLEKIVDKKKIPPLNYEDMLKKNATLGCSTVILDKSKIGDFKMPLLRTGQDYALWLSILKKGFKAYHYPVILTSYRILANSISRNKLKKACRQWQIYRTIEKIPFSSSAYYFAHYAIHAIFRK